eukprot:TRINITY_DN32729_c0_g1_i5.p1 TRINITY_DN32729_c0_g1~~TRINITY_DN32729_c0_g1_i5.p1  ORF type:complete len:176 (+),score=8.15 TRINITY_DN32729_c0_g1_i5:142-669(+)
MSLQSLSYRRPLVTSSKVQQKLPVVNRSFVGLCSHRIILQRNESLVGTVSNGALFFCMRHQKRVPKLNRPADQRKALIRGLVTQVLRHGTIKTTLARAKAIRKPVDHIVTLAKDGSDHARNQALAFVYDKELVDNIFKEVPERYITRNGGYCRVKKELKGRRGDNAPMAIVELVD